MNRTEEILRTICAAGRNEPPLEYHQLLKRLFEAIRTGQAHLDQIDKDRANPLAVSRNKKDYTIRDLGEAISLFERLCPQQIKKVFDQIIDEKETHKKVRIVMTTLCNWFSEPEAKR